MGFQAISRVSTGVSDLTTLLSFFLIRCSTGLQIPKIDAILTSCPGSGPGMSVYVPLYIPSNFSN